MPSKAAQFRNLDALICEKDDNYYDQIRQAVLIADLFKNVLRASDGSEAMTKIGRQKFGLIVVDLHAGKVDAPELVKSLRLNKMSNTDENAETPVVVTFAVNDKAKLDALKEMSDVHLIAKPFVTETLIETIIHAVGMA